MMGTDSNTLILAFAGSSVSMLLLDYAYNLPYQQIINSNNIGIAIMQGLSGSFGIVLSVPFTYSSLLSCILRNIEKQENTEAIETAGAQIHSVTEASENI